MELFVILISLILPACIGFLLKHRGAIEWLSIVGVSISVVEAFMVAWKMAFSGQYVSSSFFYIDAFGAIILLIIACVGFSVTIYSVGYLREETLKNIIGFTRVRQYFFLLNLFFLAMCFAVMVSSPILAWIAIEATTLSTVFLISFYNKPSAIEAAWKYLIINSVGLLLGFFGTLLYFISTNSLIENNIISWQLLLENVTHLNPLIAQIAFVCVLIGYGTKVGLAPMHTWLPDAHSKAPAPISALLSGVLLNVAFLVILRFKVITDAIVDQSFSQNLLIFFGVFSIIIAALITVTQKNYKRLLAYSSIENMGLAALGFGFGGLGVFAAVIHMIYHSFLKSALFLSSGTIFLKYHSTKIIKVHGVLAALPVTSIIFFIGFLAITGIPPSGIFLSKVFIFSAGMEVHPIISMIALFFTAILFIGFFKHVSAMIFGEKPVEMKIGKENIWLVISPLILLAIATYLSFFLPSFLQTLIHDVVSHY